MPRVHHRKAGKDYPDNGIKKGDMYYYTSLKLQRGGIVKRSLTPFKPSQLTTSAFKVGWFSAQETWDASGKLHEDMQSAAETIREIGQECEESLGAMPEGLQQGHTGEMLQERVDACETCADALDEAADDVENLDEPEPFTLDVPEEPDDMDDEDAVAAYDEDVSAYEDAETEHEQTASEYGDGLEAAQQAVEEALGEMP